MQSTRLQSPGGQRSTSTVIAEEGILQEAQGHFTQRGSVELIPDCLEHIFKYLSTADKGRVSKVRPLLVVGLKVWGG